MKIGHVALGTGTKLMQGDAARPEMEDAGRLTALKVRLTEPKMGSPLSRGRLTVTFIFSRLPTPFVLRRL